MYDDCKVVFVCIVYTVKYLSSFLTYNSEWCRLVALVFTVFPTVARIIVNLASLVG